MTSPSVVATPVHAGAPRARLAALQRAAAATGLPFSGELHPRDAWSLVEAGLAVLVDVRSAEELAFVGRVPGSVHVPWASGIDLARNPRFVDELGARVRRDDVLLFLCRSGKRSAAAAQAAVEAGYAAAFNVLEGFEGDLDAQRRRGRVNGWRFHGLPWSQG